MTAIAVLTSGGDAPGMNAAIHAVVKVAASRGLDVLGIERGYEGLIDGRVRPLTRRAEGGTPIPTREMEGVGAIGGTVLGSSRSARFFQRPFRQAAAERLREAGAWGLVVVGGNGSIAGAHRLADETDLAVVAIPASIDNDIGLTREALGVDTALNTIVEACDKISDTARSHHRAFVVEVMGHRSGYLAMAAAVATAAEAVLLPEQGRSFDEVVDSVASCVRDSFSNRGKRRVLILKAEGVGIPTHLLVDEVAAELSDLEDAEVRGAVLGHLVRGGNPSFRDRLLAGRFGLVAVDSLLSRRTDVMTGWNVTDTGEETSDSFIRLFPLEEVLAETESLLDGSSPVAVDRVQRMEAIHGVLAL